MTAWLPRAVLLATLTGCAGSQLGAGDRAQLPHSTAPDVREIEVSQSEVTYEVTGASSADLRSSIHDHARATWSDAAAAGMTNVNIGADVKCQEFSDGGALREAKLTLSLIVNLPNWPGEKQAPEALQASWGSFIRALRTHEAGHVAIAKRHAAALREALKSLPPQAACPELLKSAETLIRRTDAAMSKEQLGYDASTEHGATQGCIL